LTKGISASGVLAQISVGRKCSWCTVRCYITNAHRFLPVFAPICVSKSP